jgi:hypothetical protein
MSGTDSLFKFRVDSASRYYNYLEKTKNSNWIEIIKEVESSKHFGIPEVLVLLHPKFYFYLNAVDPRGANSFPPAVLSAKCRALEVWGYDCPIRDSAIHVDHMFPHSKGGSTHVQNAMYLCGEHNMSKHTDIHLILWERIPQQNDWVVKSVNHLLGFANRLTREKLYSPVSQLSRI